MYGLLENPHIYNFVQDVLSIGGTRFVRLTEACIRENCRGKVLDLGCGTGRCAHLFEDKYFAIDINHKYLVHSLQKYNSQRGKQFVCGNAKILPFKDNSFDSIFSVGVFHHIDFKSTEEIFKEIIRVGKPEATVLVVDRFYPENRLDVFGWMVGKLDRGKHVRKKENFINELQPYFKIIDYHYIKYSYPSYLYAFILQRK